MLVVNNKEYYHVKIRQNSIASFLVDKLRQSPSGSFLLDKLRKGVPIAYPIDMNKVPYSIFDSRLFGLSKTQIREQRQVNLKYYPA